MISVPFPRRVLLRAAAATLLAAAAGLPCAAFAEDVNSEMVTVLCGLAKGHVYGTALRAGLRWDYRQDPEARARLDAIAGLERGLSPQAVRSPQPLGNEVQDELALVSYIGSATPRPGAEPAEVLHNLPVQVPLWVAADRGRPDWRRIYDGYTSAVDWPTAGFCRELEAVSQEELDLGEALAVAAGGLGHQQPGPALSGQLLPEAAVPAGAAPTPAAANYFAADTFLRFLCSRMRAD